MKKTFIFFIMLFLTATLTEAQEIGARFGNAFAGNIAVDGVFTFDGNKRIHADISFGKEGVGLDALWDFVYSPLEIENLHWYAGGGVSAYIGGLFLLGVSAEAGLEYRFKFPVSVSFDWRPTFTIIEYTDFTLNNFGLNVRYVF